jgi:hypothetical protein
VKHVLPYQLFEASATAPVALTEEQVKWLDKCTLGTWKLNPQTGLVDVDGSFGCRKQRLRDLNGVRFGEVKGNFSCSRNQLTSLEGAPQKVEGYFSCQDNQLTSLEGAPQKVGKWFDCDNNQLTSLEGAPREVKRDFSCANNQLTTLEGAPREVGGIFSCSNNGLTTLEGAPQEVKGDFICRRNPVPETTLKSIFSLMKRGKSYQEALESRWDKISMKNKSLLWRPEFKWVDEKESKTLKAIRTVNNLKGMI